MTSKAEQVRRDAYDATVAALHRIDPTAVPISKYGEPYAIPRVSDQARHAAAPPEQPPSPDSVLIARISNMEGEIAHLTVTAKRLRVPLEPFPVISKDDLQGGLRALNNYHYVLEKKVNYYRETTLEQRAIDEIRGDVARLQKAMVALNKLLPLLMGRAEGKNHDA